MKANLVCGTETTATVWCNLLHTQMALYYRSFVHFTLFCNKQFNIFKPNNEYENFTDQYDSQCRSLCWLKLQSGWWNDWTNIKNFQKLVLKPKQIKKFVQIIIKYKSLYFSITCFVIVSNISHSSLYLVHKCTYILTTILYHYLRSNSYKMNYS